MPATDRNISVLFADIVGYTAIARETDAAALKPLMDEYVAAMVEIVRDGRGTVDKIMGDGIMVLFGYPNRQKRHARNAVRTARRMQRRTTELRARWRSLGDDCDLLIRIGIASGEIAIGTLSIGEVSELQAVGDTVNLASRLQARSAPGGILIDQKSYEHIKAEIECDPVEGLELKGFEDALTAYIPRSPSPARGKKTAAAGVEPHSSGESPRASEHRIYPRRQVSLFVDVDAAGKTGRNRCLDISESGAFLQSNEAVAVGTKLKISGDFPTFRGVLPVTINGKVARVSTDPEQPGLGVEFISVEAQSLSTIRYLVREVFGLGELRRRQIHERGDTIRYILDTASRHITLKGRALPLSLDRGGIGNSEFLSRRLDHEFKRTRRYGSEFATVCIALYNLDRIADEPALCDLIQEIADVIANAIRDTDELFYINEMKFFVLAPHTMRNRADTLIERIKSQIRTFLKELPGDFTFLDIDVGGFTFDGRNAESAEELILKTMLDNP